MARKFDFILFGATGFTGKYCLFEATKILSGYSFAVAGRSKAKLENVLEEMGNEFGKDLTPLPIVIADVQDYPSLLKMAQQCRVLINCCGPYRFYGAAVVRACLEAGTDHVDVTGEPQFMEKMQLEHDKQAQEKGVYVVSACGYDSIPSEMGLLFAEQQFPGTLHSADIYLKVWDKGPLLGASINYGTWHSAVYLMTRTKELREIRKRLFTDKTFAFPEPKLQTRILHKSTVGKTANWCVPYVDIDQGVSERTQRYFYDADRKRPVQMREYLALGSTIIPSVIAIIYAILMFIITRFDFGVKLLVDYPHIFSFGVVSKQGPSPIKFKTSQFQQVFHCKGWANGATVTSKPTHEMVTVVKGSNPAYGATCVALLLSALALVAEREKIPGRWVWISGIVLVDRLIN